ncbi:enoyl-CoA hydratase/isomerase family protein [Halobacillus salinarum]|uniref:Ethylmalonyl-CoA decarboxylase n=1 Tax=Halobacillus salinarum TaxID=2932257 RepID=A0ABY4EGM1_9BACI|nr:enoyl-CoA hydratase/isomerase family protein [Halobacillus salinarum]UOQ43145.1 enoyl-CoA hydratase/isomerase family protein [Halobacillus salinarum]
MKKKELGHVPEVEFRMDNQGIGRIVLNRPEKLNAITKAMTRSLHHVIDEAASFEGIKALTITGAGGKAFCAGGDLTELHGNMNAEEAYLVLSPMKEALLKLARFPVPTIALLNGQARGGGCEIATACDFRYGTEEGTFGFVQASLGITPGWGGGALLFRRIQPTYASHWLTDASMYDAFTAKRIGWLNNLLPQASLQKWEEDTEFTNRSSSQMKWFKKQLLAALRSEEFDQLMEEEVKQCAALWEEEDHKRAVEKFLKTRKKS